MTRRGSLAYYLAAWICGCFFMSAAVWTRDLQGATPGIASMHSAFGLLFFSFYGLIWGAGSSLAGGFLLRRMARAARLEKTWQWVTAGAAIAPVVIFLLGAIYRNGAMHDREPKGLLAFFTRGPAVVLSAGWWLAIPAGAATAWVLFRVHRAFGMATNASGASPGR
ncbi:MAG: hypothetical protein ACRD50_10580 [Candidatus Acidiferrales bacterium]